jgi:Ca-activated chloride channel family protein
MHASAALLAFALTIALSVPLSVRAQEQDDPPRFRASVDVVTIAAVVRDKHGRVVPSLTKDDFTVLEGGQKRPIVEFQPDANGPISVALLIDGSGSMRQSSAISKRLGETLLALLNAHSDEMALMSFDTRLITLRDFTSDFQQLRAGLNEVETWGATSLYDAIAGAAAVVEQHTRKRRAVLVVTDGSDNWSTYSAEKVAWIASTIDVPVYVLAVTANAAGASDAQTAGGELGDLARATGADYFSADTETRQAMALGRIIEDLRHQYLIAIEPSRGAGLRSLEIRTRKPTLKVRARQWYAAQSED